MAFFKSMMNTLRKAKKEMRARIVQLEKENSALLSKVSALEQDRERFQKKLVLTGQELLTARKQARENLCALTTLRDEVNQNVNAVKDREETICKECRSRSSMGEKLQSHVAEQDVENRALQEQLSARCESNVKRIAVTEPQKADTVENTDGSQKIESEAVRGENHLAQIQSDKIPDGSQEDLHIDTSDHFFSLAKAVERLYQETEAKNGGLDGVEICTAGIGCMEDSTRNKPYLIPSKDVLPKGILRPPREHVESEKNDHPYWLENPSRQARRCPRKVRFC